MKRINYVATVGVLVGLIFAGTAAAETGTAPKALPREQLQDKKGELQGRKVEMERASTSVSSTTARTRMQEKQKNVVREHAQRILKNLSEPIDRLENIANRIGSRLDKLATQGTSVAELRTKLAAARVKIADAKTAVANISTLIETVLTSDTPKKSFETALVSINDAREKVKAAHAALVDVTNSIKPGTLKATTTPSETR